MRNINLIYADYIKAKNKIENLEHLLQHHPDVDDLVDPKRIEFPPRDIISKYREYIIGRIFGVPKEFITNQIVGEMMHEYVKLLPVFSLDYQQIVNHGWRYHALEDTNPRVAICEMIEEEYEKSLKNSFKVFN